MAQEKTQKWPADNIERRSVASLVPYARNARTHSEQQVAQIAASIREWGWTTPVLVDEAGMIIAGHGRILAAQKLGISEVPVMVASGWTEAQTKAYVIADNKLALNAGWDEELLRVEIGEISDSDFDVSLIGFSEDELENIRLPREEGETDADSEWEGMPEYENENKESFRHIIIHFENNDDVSEFFSLIGQSHTEKTKSIWFPEKENMDTEAKRYG